MRTPVGYIGGLGPVELLVVLSLLLLLAFIFWVIRRPVNQRIDELETKFEERLDELERRIDDRD